MTKKQWMKIILFCATALFLLTCVTYVTRSMGEAKERFAGFYAEKKDTLDVVFIGSSQAYSAFAAPQLWGEHGIASYVLATNYQRPAAARWLTREVLNHQKPRLLVYEVHLFINEEQYMTGNMAYTRNVTDSMRYSKNRIDTIRALVPEDDAEGRLTYYLDVFKYHSNWRLLAFPSQWKYALNRYPHPLKGFTANDKAGAPERTDDAVAQVKTRTPVPEEQERYLRELLAELSASGQEALFVVAPYASNAEDTERFLYLSDVMAEYGYPFLNLNLDPGYDAYGLDFATDFNDPGVHLNAQGAEKVTACLGEYLAAHYEFPDHAGDARYASFDSAYETWRSETERAKQTIAQRIADGDINVP